MKETMDKLDKAGIVWVMEVREISVGLEDKMKTQTALPLTVLERHGSRLIVRHDLPPIAAAEMPVTAKVEMVDKPLGLVGPKGAKGATGVKGVSTPPDLV